MNNSKDFYEKKKIKESQYRAQNRDTEDPPWSQAKGRTQSGLYPWDTSRLSPKEPHGSTLLWAHHRSQKGSGGLWTGQ